MRTPQSYDYAIVRVVPRVEREEFINAGVVLSCPSQGFLGARIELDEARLLSPADDGVDLAAVRGRISRAFRSSAPAALPPGPIGTPVTARALPLAGRPAQHHHPDVCRPHGQVREPGGRRSSTCFT